MKLLIFGDIYWRIWRKALKKELPILKEKYNPDFIIVNVDNASSGRWIIEKHALELENLWIDLMTSWDHIFDNFEKIKDYLKKEDSKLIRPANFYNDKVLEGIWYKILEKNWYNLLVIHLLDEVFINHKVYNPFLKAKEIIDKFQNKSLDWIVIDFHKEASSSWYWLSFYLNNQVSFIFWTHTHIQTNDDIIFEEWNWLISDVGMTWALYSVIWADYKSLEKRFLTWISKGKIEQSLNKKYVVNWVFVEIEDFKTKNIEKIKKIWNL